jgi:hypothetical protein
MISAALFAHLFHPHVHVFSTHRYSTVHGIEAKIVFNRRLRIGPDNEHLLKLVADGPSIRVIFQKKTVRPSRYAVVLDELFHIVP